MNNKMLYRDVSVLGSCLFLIPPILFFYNKIPLINRIEKRYKRNIMKCKI